jgi:hypothetical protein
MSMKLTPPCSTLSTRWPAVALQLVFFLLWGHLQTTWAYYISAVMTSAQAAVIWAVSIVIFSGLIANLVMVQFVQFGPAWLAMVLQLLPSFGLYRGLWELSSYAFLADSNGGSGGVIGMHYTSAAEPQRRAQLL